MLRRYFFLCVLFLFVGCGNPSGIVETGADDTANMAKAFAQQQSDFWVEAEGTVVKHLSDDLTGDRHQRFILRLSNGQTLLMSYNIDIAKRINDLKAGDRIRFRGEYEWNEKGGVVHWLHHDPKFLQPGGWIKHNGKIYK